MNLPAPDAAKPAWRAWAARRRRDGIPAEAGEAIVAGVAAWLPQAPPGVVVLFLPLGDEVDLRPLVERLDRRFALTRTPRPGGLLTVHPYEAPRERHPYGFDQPVAEAPVIPAKEIGVVLVPGLVFDVAGGRLGRGAGYFDRFLPTLEPSTARVGIVPEALVVDRLPAEPHDVAMTHLATEEGVRSVSH